MGTYLQRTTGGEITREGVGVHTGEAARVTLRPAAFGQGIRFLVGGEHIPARVSSARAEDGCSLVEGAVGSVRTPEHLLAAIHGLRFTDLEVEVEGPEVPILDGSSRPWVDALVEAGSFVGEPLEVRTLPRVRVEAAGGWAEAAPTPDALEVHVDFGAGGPQGCLRVSHTEADFRTEVASARTFVLARDVAMLRAAGRGRGATPENTVVWPQAPLRTPDEPVRHKMLDLWGDLALLGPYTGFLKVVRGSHRLHHALLRALMAGAG